MKASVKLGLVFLGVVVVAGGGLGTKHYLDLIARAEASQLEASRALMQSEELVWTLEGECLKDAQRVFAMPDAKELASTPTSNPEERMRVEMRLRQFLRIRRSPKVWKATERAFLTMTNESRAATNDAAFKAGLRPVDILSEWMTFEGGSDLALMTNVYNGRTTLRATAGPILDTFFPEGAPAPSAAEGVKIVEHADDKIVIDLFGARVIEEWVRGKRVEVSGEGKAKISWKSNYNYLSDLVKGGKPEMILEETLVRTDEGFGVEYRELIKEYLAGGDKLPWASVLCLEGPLAVGALKSEKEDKDEKPPEKGEKAPEKGEKAPEKHE